MIMDDRDRAHSFVVRLVDSVETVLDKIAAFDCEHCGRQVRTDRRVDIARGSARRGEVTRYDALEYADLALVVGISFARLELALCTKARWCLAKEAHV